MIFLPLTIWLYLVLACWVTLMEPASCIPGLPQISWGICGPSCSQSPGRLTDCCTGFSRFPGSPEDSVVLRERGRQADLPPGSCRSEGRLGLQVCERSSVSTGYLIPAAVAIWVAILHVALAAADILGALQTMHS